MDTYKKGFLQSSTLKIIAVITMIIDHIGYIFIDPQSHTQIYLIFRSIGRIAFPIFCFLLIEGFQHTRNHINYLIRLSLFAILSEIPFDLAFRHTLFDWQHQNVFITLALGLLSLFCLEELNNRRYYAFPLIVIWTLSYVIHCDYGLGGVLLIDILYLTQKNPMIRIFLSTLILYVFFGQRELYGILALPLLQLYNGKRGLPLKMLFYWIYPLHLLLFYFISALIH